MEREGLWTRMGRWFRGAGLRASADLPPVGRDGLLAGFSLDDNGARPGETSSPKLSRHQRHQLRAQALDRLQDGHLKVITLIESLQKHMESQDRRGEVMAGALVGIAGHLAGLSETAQRQTETLGVIATQLQTGNDRARRWEEAFAQFPALAEAQRTTLATLSEQVAAGRQADERIGESLGAVRGALDCLDRSTTSSAGALQRLQEASARSQELVGELIHKQRKWLAFLVVVSLCAALAAVALAVMALVRR
ncbi:MAG: hypothetical protein V2A79_16110 [Planctomycetota bacterium]